MAAACFAPTAIQEAGSYDGLTGTNRTQDYSMCGLKIMKGPNQRRSSRPAGVRPSGCGGRMLPMPLNLSFDHSRGAADRCASALKAGSCPAAGASRRAGKAYGGAVTLFRRGRRPGSRRIRFSKAFPQREPGHPRCRRQESGRAPTGRPSAAVRADAGGGFQGFSVVFSGLRPSCRGGACGNRGQAARSPRAFRGKRRSRPAGHNLSRGFYVRAAEPSGGRCSRL